MILGLIPRFNKIEADAMTMMILYTKIHKDLKILLLNIQSK